MDCLLRHRISAIAEMTYGWIVRVKRVIVAALADRMNMLFSLNEYGEKLLLIQLFFNISQCVSQLNDIIHRRIVVCVAWIHSTKI